MSTHGMERLMSRGHDDLGPEPGGTPGIVASIAPTTAATCRGPGCRRKITKGELRLQVGLPESDYIISDSSYGESVSGFYCFQVRPATAALTLFPHIDLRLLLLPAQVRRRGVPLQDVPRQEKTHRVQVRRRPDRAGQAHEHCRYRRL